MNLKKKEKTVYQNKIKQNANSKVKPEDRCDSMPPFLSFSSFFFIQCLPLSPILFCQTDRHRAIVEGISVKQSL
jgi:hypothetical protein